MPALWALVALCLAFNRGVLNWLEFGDPMSEQPIGVGGPLSLSSTNMDHTQHPYLVFGRQWNCRYMLV